MLPKIQRLDGLCLFAVTVYSTTATVIALCLPELIDEFSLQYSISGTIESIRTFGVCVAFIGLGLYAAGLSKKHILWSSYLLLSLGLMGLSFSTGQMTLMLGAFIIGFASGISSGTINALVFDMHPDNPSPYLGLILACFPLGLIVASFLFGFMLDTNLDWRWVPRVSGALNLVATILFIFPKFPASQDQKTANILPYFAIMLRLRIFWFYGAAIFIAGGVEAFFVFWSRTYLDTYFDISAQASSMSLAIFAFTMGLGRIAMDSLLKLTSLANIVRLAAILGVTAGILMPFTNQLLFFYLLLAVSGFSVSYLWQLVLLEGAQNLPVQKMVSLSSLALCGMSGLTFYPLISGVIAQAVDLKAATILLPISFGILMVFSFFFKYDSGLTNN